MGLLQQQPQRMSGERRSAAIVGYGDEGESIYRYLSAQGSYDITIIDDASNPKRKLPVDAKTILGPGSIDQQKLDYDEVWRASPQIAPGRLNVISAEVKTITREFFAKCPAPIIGVTGSKGKGTTSSLIYEILKSAGITAHLLGNIGRPALDELNQIKPSDVVVFELSSFQLWDLDKSPHIAVVLMIEPDHLDIHKDLSEYLQAKQNIARWQVSEDFVVHHPTNQHSLFVAQVGLGSKQAFLTTDGANIVDSKLLINEQTICSISDFGLIGPHNHENIAAAVTAAWHYTQDAKAIAKAISNFKGLEHRLQTVATKAGVTYIDDSIATTPSAAMAAINSFESPKILILGGSDKGADFSGLAELIASKNVKQTILIGAMADKIAGNLEGVGYKNIARSESMAEAVKAAHEIASSGDVVILSPACASFDMFDNYQDRGQQFSAAVASIG